MTVISASEFKTQELFSTRKQDRVEGKERNQDLGWRERREVDERGEGVLIPVTAKPWHVALLFGGRFCMLCLPGKTHDSVWLKQPNLQTTQRLIALYKLTVEPHSQGQSPHCSPNMERSNWCLGFVSLV